MGFSKEVKDEILVSSARHCCVCHKAKGLNIEVHHISPQQQGGDDTAENAIALCFDCHSDAGHYFAGHPKGTKLSPEELKKHKFAWFKAVRDNNIELPKESLVEIKIQNEDFDGSFNPIFIKKITRYDDREKHKEVLKLLNIDPMESLKEMKSLSKGHTLVERQIDKIQTFDDYLDFLNDDNFLFPEQVDNCQPVRHKFGAFSEYAEINKSNCVLRLKLINHGPDVLEDYKVYLRFRNVISVDSVNKRTSAFDAYRYDYDVLFSENMMGEFTPTRNTLVQKDSVSVDAICFRPDPNSENVIVDWELFARNFHFQGSLILVIKPTFEEDDRLKYVKSTEVADDRVEILPKVEISYPSK